jgi:hypothetical protein
VKKIIRDMLALLWKLIRTYALRWVRDFIGRFAKLGVLVVVGAFAVFALFMLLLSAAC